MRRFFCFQSLVVVSRLLSTLSTIMHPLRSLCPTLTMFDLPRFTAIGEFGRQVLNRDHIPRLDDGVTWGFKEDRLLCFVDWMETWVGGDPRVG